ncbi:divalent-cation tolerance protein CutA [Burkholderia sp. L27(2015)]|uniref:divalent-cation tolerance protein CutA n=1 Tax=Burkholderia sp. L27(2015) TaxID=1641858 RepID=UPI00131DA1FB|nr:divalent-cation tolerance protein CutA [Burkholderia sp. L27(2015)]
MTTPSITLILTTLPDATAAEGLALGALSARLAACATRLAPVESSYHWEGRIESATEYPVLFKTSAAGAAALQVFIATHHPYQVPEILSWDAAAAPAYGQWVHAETSKNAC